MKDSEKVELTRLARLASDDVHRDSFWDEVDKILEEDEKPLVRPREERD
jgi:hypothetical protein